MESAFSVEQVVAVFTKELLERYVLTLTLSRLLGAFLNPCVVKLTQEWEVVGCSISVGVFENL